MTPVTRRALVLGATGFIGRNLIIALAESGAEVVAGCRSEASFENLTSWLDHRGATRPELALVDLSAPGLGMDADDTAGITEIHNCAGAYRFGMDVDEARRANVESVRTIVALAATVPALERLVHISGYRVGGQDPASVPWDADRVRRTYHRLGAYEASKIEADAVFQAEARRLGVPWNVVNPSTVSGVAATGESEQYVGLPATFKELWKGRLTALPGDEQTFVPVVPVDYLARFMCLLPTDPGAEGKAFWVLDDATPPLPELLRLVGSRYGVPVPRTRVPVALVRRLPRSLSKADPETLSFLSTDRYPVESAVALAEGHGLRMPAATEAIPRWADHLAAHRFGEQVSSAGQPRGFVDIAGTRTFTLGSVNAATVVLPGLPGNADTWTDVLGDRSDLQVVDLPGSGLSSGGSGDWQGWADRIVSNPAVSRLIGHGTSAAVAIAAADRHPGHLDELTLVSPFFLMPLAKHGYRTTRRHLRGVPPHALSRELTGSGNSAHSLASTVSDLRRHRHAATAAAQLRRTLDPSWRAELVGQLARYPGLVHLVVGTEEPWAAEARPALARLGDRLRVTVIDGAGDHPQLTHADQLAHGIAPSRTLSSP